MPSIKLMPEELWLLQAILRDFRERPTAERHALYDKALPLLQPGRRLNVAADLFVHVIADAEGASGLDSLEPQS